MKILIFAFLLCINISVIAQVKTNSAVNDAFNRKFPNAENVKWEKEDAHEYEAEFRIQEINYSASFSERGEWLETETSLTFSQLPVAVQNAFNEYHKGEKTVDAAKIETSDGKIKFEIEIRKGSETNELNYLSDGTEIND